MTKIEASALPGMIEGQSCLKPHAHQIGNGEWVAVVNHAWLWDSADWDRQKYQWRKSLYSLEVRKR
jgi:hypothetical protein